MHVRTLTYRSFDVRTALLLMLSFFSLSVHAEGRCPPGQFPVGGQGMLGCAPIPGGSGGGEAAPAAPRPTGKWETRWGAIVEDAENNSTGTAASQKSKRAAVSLATERCEQGGGRSCKLRLAYHNQCVALADPTTAFVKSLPLGARTRNMASSAETEDLAKSNAMRDCETAGSRQECYIVYSECSMSEFKRF